MMTGKWKIGIAVSALLLSGCAKASTLPKKNEPLTLVIATDLHLSLIHIWSNFPLPRVFLTLL